MPGKILVIRGGAIGDFILTTPVLAALRGQFPDSEIEVLGYPHIVQLAIDAGLADEVRSIESRPLAGFFAQGGALDDELADYFAGFAVIISYLYDPDAIFQINVARCSGAQFLVGLHRPDDRAGVHATEVFLKPLERLAIFGADPVPRFRLAASLPPRLPPGRWLAVHPGSGSESKNWPAARWVEFLDLVIRQSDWRLLLIGGESEGQRVPELARRLPADRWQLACNLPLPGLAQLLRECQGYVGHDSGISHLAAAVGLPGWILWGRTAEAVWRPQGPGMQLVRHPGGLADLPASQLFQLLPRPPGHPVRIPPVAVPGAN
jgi:heptosyltransferase III